MEARQAVTKLQIRDAELDDMHHVLRLNAAVVEWTSPMDKDRLQALTQLALHYRVAELEGRVAGFLMAMRDFCGYGNDNLQWFEQRYRQFLYVDRVVVDHSFAGRGVGRALYEELFSVAEKQGYERVVCEYSWVPRNLSSEGFHQRLGFSEVGKRTIPSSSKVVSMQCRPV